MGRKKNVFSGCATALVTPFYRGEIDFSSLGELIDFQIANGADALVLLGTSGEASTISEQEREKIISFGAGRIAKRVPLIVGCGSNCTETSVKYSKSAEVLGADALLVVTPYYNKASESGLCAHYKSVAASVSLPIIIYNVPSRTGVSVPMSVYRELSRVDNIVAVKEASGNIAYAEELCSLYGSYFDVYSGNDDIILPLLSLGAKGVISATANIVPSYIHQLCREYEAGNIEKSRQIQLYLLPLIKEMFAEVNPIPVKTALSLMGMCHEEFRLPMCKSTRSRHIRDILRRYSLIGKQNT